MLKPFSRFARAKNRFGARLVLHIVLGLVLASAPQIALSADDGRAPGDWAGAVDPEADALLRAMCDYLGSIQAFTVEARNTMEVVLVNGQKLNFEAASNVWVKRPNHIRSQRTGVADEADFYYDGAAATLSVRQDGMDFYAVAAMPASLDAALDILRADLGLEFPGADFLYSDAYDGLSWDVVEARRLGVESLGGVMVHHLAFRTTSVDFEVWVGDGDRPLPYKYLITTKWTTGAPQFGVELSNWNLSPTIDGGVFEFTPLPGAIEIDFLAAGGAMGEYAW